MRKYTVAQVGVGNRGTIHLDGFLANRDRFELVGVCDLDAEKLAREAGKRGIAPTFADADEMLAAASPDVFCFVTPPDVRLPLVELGVRHGAKAIAFEKPMALSLQEARRIVELCEQGGVKTIVSHQQKYMECFRRARELLENGEIGDVTMIHATARGGLTGIGTHIIDYAMWLNGGSPVRWALGHVHGRPDMDSTHPGPGHAVGQLGFENGARALVECGTMAPVHRDPAWLDNRLTVYGTLGYVWAETDNVWSALTKSSGGRLLGGQGRPWIEEEREHLQPPYLRELADWLDDDAEAHSCRLEVAYHGYEAMTALCLSALENRRIDLPLDDWAIEAGVDAFGRMARELPDATA